MSQVLKVAVNGAAGRMGRAVLAVCSGELSETTKVVAALESPSSPHVGETVSSLVGAGPDIKISADHGSMIQSGPDVVIDFSIPDSSIALLQACVAASLPMVTGTTGWSQSQYQQLCQGGESLPLMVAPNMSVGVNLCLALLEQAAAVMTDADVEITEMHHKAKMDAPSGTALAMGEAISTVLGSSHDAAAIRGNGDAVRQPGSIGYSSLRIADAVGEHTVIFGVPGERVEISHRAYDRGIFARGALRAASWLVMQPAGVYGMREVLGLSGTPLKK